MSSAETTQPIEWRDDGAGGWQAYVGEDIVGAVAGNGDDWTFVTYDDGNEGHPSSAGSFPTASAARSFVEKSVKEAGHGE